ncbi:MAG TPA: hypothetical protein VGJ17_09370 [Candidatus Limnocylindrales bacterium]
MAWDDDIGDEPKGALRDAPPDLRSPIDPRAPVGGHQPLAEPPTSIHDSPEHDWGVASELVMPLLRPLGSHGTRLAEIDASRLASEGLRAHALPVVDEGPSGLLIAYAIRAGGFDVLVNADHLLEWRISPPELRAAAMTNLGRWSTGVGWTEEIDGQRHLISSDSGDGHDASRILLQEVRRHLVIQLGEGCRILVAMPDRHLLLAGACRVTDPTFPELFAAFVEAHADGADEPIDRRVFELVSDDLKPFEP